MRSDDQHANATAARPASEQQSLADLLEQLTEAIDAGDPIDTEELFAKYPEHAGRLRDLIPTMRAMATWGEAPGEPDAGKAHTPSEPPLAGVLGDFRIVGEIGRGGMGAVYEAEQISMGRRVALKVLPFAALAQSNALQRFRNEVRAVAALDHPNIVSVYSVGEERGIHYYAMRLIRGQSLAEAIREMRGAGQVEAKAPRSDSAAVNGGLDRAHQSTLATQARLSTVAEPPFSRARFRQAARLALQAARALQHAHDQGVVHRDIKPGNLLLDAEQRLYVTDFGLARIEADAGVTMTGDLVGTLRYMAPEQALGKRVVIDHRADIYGLGATLYELLTLRPAFGSSDRAELLRQIALEEPLRPRKLDSRIPAELETIVSTAMAKSPEARYQSAQELADDLEAYLAQLPIRAKPPTLLQRAGKWSRRHVALAWTVAVATLLIAAATSTAAVVYLRQTEKAQAAEERAETAMQTAKGRLSIALDAMDQLSKLADNPWIATIGGFQVQQEMMLRETIAMNQKLATLSAAEAEDNLTTASKILQIARLRSRVGDYQQASESFAEALGLLDDGKSASDSPADFATLRVAALLQFSDFLRYTSSELPERSQAAWQALRAAEQLQGKTAHAPLYVAAANFAVARLLMDRGNTSEALRHLRNAKALLREGHDNTYRFEKAEGQATQLLRLFYRTSDPATKPSGVDEATDLMIDLLAAYPSQARDAYAQIGLQANAALEQFYAAQSEKEVQRSVGLCLELLPRAEALVEESPTNPDYLAQLYSLYSFCGLGVQAAKQQHQAADLLLAKAIAGLESCLEGNRSANLFRDQLLKSYHRRAIVILGSPAPAQDERAASLCARRAWDLDNQSWRACSTMAATAVAEENWDEAWRYATRSIAIRGNDRDRVTCYILAIAAAAQGETERASQWHTRATARSSRASDSPYLRRLMQKAASLLGEASPASFAEASTLRDLAGDRFFDGDILSAYALFDRAIDAVHPADWETMNQLAWRLADVGEYRERAFELALEACEQSDYMFPTTLDTLAKCHAELGDYERAVQWEEKAIALAPDSRQRLKFAVRLEAYRRGDDWGSNFDLEEGAVSHSAD
ncbi:protein kinase [Botrimarina sp.]|uniref:protein kinase domain-containing protein n=1 Tax=Botrimarina sp. TaxID=2795802 RepID=UPI0032ED3886